QAHQKMELSRGIGLQVAASALRESRQDVAGIGVLGFHAFSSSDVLGFGGIHAFFSRASRNSVPAFSPLTPPISGGSNDARIIGPTPAPHKICQRHNPERSELSSRAKPRDLIAKSHGRSWACATRFLASSE